MDEKKIGRKSNCNYLRNWYAGYDFNRAFARAGAIAGIIGRNKAVAYVQ